MTHLHRSTRHRFLVAIGVTMAALLVRLMVAPWAGATSPHLFFAPAVMLAAWYGGFGPGILSTLTGAALANYFLLAPTHGFSLTDDSLVRTIVFLLVGAQISWLSGRMHVAREAAVADAEAARRSERIYRTLAANFPDGFVCLFDRELRWTLVAGAGLEVAGLAREQMEGRWIIHSLPPDTAAAVEPMCAAALDGKSTQAEVNHNGRIYFCHALPLRGSEDATHVGMVILEDVTERVKARQALQWAHDNLEQRVHERTAELHFQKTLLESQSQASADGILAVDNDGKVIFANRRLLEIWGLESVLDEHFDQVRRQMRRRLQVRQRDPLSADHDELAVHEPEGSEELILSDGRIIERYSAPIIDPAGVSFGRVWFFRDVTERKRMQRQVLEAAETERQRIGQDLHDDLCQQLTGIACLGQALQEQLTRRDPTAAAAAMEIVEHVQHANQRARDLAKGLQPMNLQRQGVAASLQGLANQIQSVFHVTCHFEAENVPDEVDEVVAIQLYRIAQEAISNAIRHGKAKNVLIDVIGVGERLILTIEDDGTGISQPLPEGGMGLHTMSYRAKLVGGSLTIGPALPRGTIVTCTAPSRAPMASAERESVVEAKV